MPTEFKLPELGENIAAGDVVRVMVSPGDTVAKDQPVLELETDKATIEVPSSVGGTVKDVKISVGDKVKVGQVILLVEEGAAAAETARPKPQPEGAPEEGGSSQEAPEETAKNEAAPKAAQPATPQPEGAKGQPRGPKSQAPAEESAIEPAPEEAEPEEAEPEESEAPPRARRGEVVASSRGAKAAAADAAPARETAQAPAAPSVRRLARELGVDIAQVPGTGPGGRISADDVTAYARWIISSVGGARMGPGRPGTAPLPDFTKWGEVERRRMSGIRRKTAEHLTYAWTTVPHVTQYEKADVTALEELRKRHAPQVEQAGGKLTVTAIALKIAAAALRRFPQFNSSVDLPAEEIVYKKYVHIGVAVDTDRGLLVPVVRDVDRKSVTELSVELAHLSARARDRKLRLDEMEGGGFTITNLGGIGGTAFSPIVNSPEVAILGIARGSMEPVFHEGQFQPRLMLPLSLSYDHRVIDGADAARFLRWVAQAFEEPFLLSL
jgi:pyruvate dehydrogenase E2 component (dihydrolipoamide acetyltransferase)